MNSSFLTAKEAAVYIKRTLPALRNLSCRGAIPYSRPAGGKVYYMIADLDAFMGSNRRASNMELADRADAMLLERR